MHVFKTTFPGTQAQADYIEHALHVIEAKWLGDLSPREGESFDWIVGLDVGKVFGSIIADDVRVTHDQARMEITIEPGGDENDMDWDIRDLDMNLQATAFVIHEMLKSQDAEQIVSFPYVDLKEMNGGVVMISKDGFTIETSQQAITRLVQGTIPF